MIFNAIKELKDSFNKEPIKINIDENSAQEIINQYNDMKLSADAFTERTKLTDVSLQEYFSTVKSGEATFTGYKAYVNSAASATGLLGVKAKITAVAMKTLKAALSAVGIMLAVTAIQALITVFDNIIHKKEKIAEAAKNAKEKIDELTESFESQKTSVEDIKKRYAELAQGVDLISNKNISLSTEDYEEFLNLSNKLANLFPNLTRNYDSNGNAILDLSGNVNTIVGSLDALIDREQQLLTQQILKEMPSVYSGYKQELEEYNEELDLLENKSQALQNLISADYSTNQSPIEGNKILSWKFSPEVDEEALMYLQNELFNALNTANIDLSKFIIEGTSDLETGGKILTLSIPEVELEDYDGDIKTVLGEYFSGINEEIQLARTKLENETAEFNSYLNTWLSNEHQFKKQDVEIQTALKEMLFKGDWISEAFKDPNVDADNWDSIANWIERNYLYAIDKVNDNEIKKKIISLGTLDNPFEKINVAQELQDYFDKNEIPISLDFILDENTYDSTQSIVNVFKKSLEDISGGSETDMRKLVEYTASFDESQMNYWIKITDGIHGASKAINEHKNSLKAVFNSDDFFTDKNIEAIDEYKNKISDLAGYLSTMDSEGKLSADDLSKLNVEYGIVADSIEEYKKAIIEEMNMAVQNSDVMLALANAIESCDDVASKSKLQALYDVLLGINTEAQESAMAFYDLENAVSTLESSASIMRELNDLIQGQDFIDTSKANEIVSQFPEMAEAVAKHNAGLITSRELFSLLEEAYEDDKDIYAKSIAYKMRHDEDYFDKFVNENIPDWVNDLADAYKIDLINYKTLNEQKLALDKEYTKRKNILDNHIAVIDATKKIEESSDTIIGKHLAQNINAALDESYIKAKENFDAINTVISAVEDSFDADASWREFGANESGDSSKDNTTEIDWADQSLKVLQDEVDKFQTALDNTKGLDNQIKAIDVLNDALKKLKDGYKSAYDEYEDRYINAVGGLGSDIRKKIESGEEFDLSVYDSDTAETIQNAIDYYNNMIEAREKIKEVSNNIDANENIEKSKLLQESYESQLDTINTKLDSQTLTVEEKNKLLTKQLKLQNAINDELRKQAIYEDDSETVSKLNAEDKNNKIQNYLDRLQNNKEQNQVYIDLYETMLDDTSLKEPDINQLNNNLQNRTNNDFMYQFKEIIATIDSKLWNDYISALKETYNETDVSDTEFVKDHIEEIVSYFDYTGLAKLYQEYLNSEEDFKKTDYETKKNTRSYYINDAENEIQNIQSDIEYQGGRGTEIQYENIQALYKKSKSFWVEQKTDAEEMLKTCEEGTSAWNDWNNEIQECETNIDKCDSEIKKCNISILQLPLNEVEDALKDIQKKLDEINDSIEDQDKNISVAVGIIDQEIQGQEILKEAIQDKIDALQEENELRETNLAIQKAEWELEKLKNQKTNKVFYEGTGWVYESNPDEIQNAEQAYNEAIYNKKIYLLNEQIKVYDNEIERLNDIKEMWSNITSQIQFTMDLNEALRYDADFYTKVLTEDLSLLNSISSAYSSLVEQKSAYETQQEDYTTLQDIINETVELYNLEGIGFVDAKQRIAEAIKYYYPGIVAQYNDEEETLDRVAEKKLRDAGVTEETSEDMLEDVTNANKLIIESYHALLTDLTTIFGILDLYMSNFADNAQAMANTIANTINGIQGKIDSLSEKDFSVTISSGDVEDELKVKKAGKSHSGLELGYIGESSKTKNKDDFKYIALNELSDNEIVRVLQKGEGVITESQIGNVMSNFKNLSQFKVPNFIPNNQQVQSVNFNGDIIVQGNNGDVNSFAKSIKQNLPSAMLQQLYK